MEKGIHFTDGDGQPLATPVLSAFLNTIFPAFVKKAQHIEIAANRLTSEFQISYWTDSRKMPLASRNDFHPFIVLSRIRIIAGLSIAPEVPSQVGSIHVCFQNQPIEVGVEIETQGEIDKLRLTPLWQKLNHSN